MPEAAIDRQTPEMNLMRLSDRARVAGGDGGAVAAAAGGGSAVRCGGDEVQGDCDGAGGADRDGDVAVARARAALRRTLTRASELGRLGCDRKERGQRGRAGAMSEHVSKLMLSALADGELERRGVGGREGASDRVRGMHAEGAGGEPVEAGDFTGGAEVRDAGGFEERMKSAIAEERVSLGSEILARAACVQNDDGRAGLSKLAVGMRWRPCCWSG